VYNGWHLVIEQKNVIRVDDKPNNDKKRPTIAIDSKKKTNTNDVVFLFQFSA